MRHPVLFTLVSFASLVSCATSARGPKVVQTTTPPPGCVLVGPIKGSDESIQLNKPWEHIQIGESKKAAIADALDQASAKGATHATLDKPKRLDRGFSVDGMAFDCSSHATAASAPAAAGGEAPPDGLGCFKDTDCKGERICRNRACVDP